MVRRLLYGALYAFIQRIVLKTRVRGHIAAREPLVLVSNHVGSLGPVSIMSSLRRKLYPWVAHEVTERREVRRYLQKEFTEPELRLKGAAGRFVSALIGLVCVSLMRGVEAIPVYKKSRKLRQTLERSLSLLVSGKTIVVFPEDTERRINEVFCEFSSGFLNLARHFYRMTRHVLRFVPVAVHPRLRVIRLGEPVAHDPSVPFSVEKRRLHDELQARVHSLYRAVEQGSRRKAVSRAS